MKANNNLSNHPTFVNDCYRIASEMNKASNSFRAAQDTIRLRNAYKSDTTDATINEQLDDAIKALREAAAKLEALKKNYKAYATQL